MSVADIKVESRDKIRHGTVSVLRRAGRVPGVWYTHGEDTVSFSIDALDLQHLLQTESNILNVHFPDGTVKQSIIRELQRDPVTGKVIHLDLMGIKLTEKVKLSIPIILTGTPAGVKEGGILEHLIREVEVEGLPLEIPEHLEVDVSELKIGDAILLGQIKAEQFRFVTDTKHPVANVVQPKVVKEPEPVAVEEEAAEGGEEKAGEENAEDS